MIEVYRLWHQQPDDRERQIGNFRSRSAVDAYIHNARWQPAQRDSLGGFRIETRVLDQQFCFTNDSNAPMDLIVEPWASLEVIEPGSVVEIHYPSPQGRADESHAEYDGNTITFWCEGGFYALVVDGERVLV